MLLRLHVKNLALIDECEVDFGPGLNILTGETGAGKSIIIGSVNLAMGEKVPKEMLRENAEYALAELVFSIEHEVQKKMLEELDIFPEEGEIILSRKIMAGRSVGKINSESVSVSKLGEVAAILLDIHGQHEHQSLLHKRKHLEILDEYAKEQLKDKKEAMEATYSLYSRLLKEQKESLVDDSQRVRELSFLEYEIKEIGDAELVMGEDEELEANYKRMANGRKILDAAGAAYDLVSSGRDAASDNLGSALKEISSVSQYDKTLGDLEAQLEEIDSLLNDFSRELSSYLSDAEFSEEEFERTERRLDEINRLKAKYGGSIAMILKQKKEKEERYEKLVGYEEYLEDLKKNLLKAEATLKEASEEVSQIRQTAAKELCTGISQSLLDLNFLDVKFIMNFDRLENYSANGIDDGEFLISTNPGEPVKPLGKVASGGELSRIMLAIKTILAENDVIGTLIFDEIDTGISGRTAQMVAEKMNLIGKSHQVICITHLPQIAAMADTQFLIEKSVVENSTISTIRHLDNSEIVGELARMMGGVKITDAVLESAREMRELALTVK